MLRQLLAGCLSGCVLALTCGSAAAAPFNPDTDPSRISWTQLSSMLGPVPDMRGQRFGVVLKTPTNEYWRLMAAGYRRRAALDGVKLDIQAAQSESDQARQLSIMQNMVGNRYRAILISPISASNLQPAIDQATAARVPVIDVDGAVVDSVRHFVGPINRIMGVTVARWFIEHYPSGGKVAVIEGQAGVLSTIQRSAGFRETLLATGKFNVVASLSAEWDRKLAFDVTTAIVRASPDLIGIYCNNDTMALGTVDAVRDLGRGGQIRVFGSDGTGVAYDSIKAGDMTGTVDIFPSMIGGIGLEIGERISAGQVVPRVVETPQVLITRDNVSTYSGDDAQKREALLRSPDARP